MKPLVLPAFLLVASAAWGQADGGWDRIVTSDTRRVVADDKIIYGSKVDFDAGTIFRKGFELAFAPRTFRKNWPFYGYAVPMTMNREIDPCGRLYERHPDLMVGKAAIVLSKQYGAAPGPASFDYIGFPVKSVAIIESDALAAPAGNMAVRSAPEYPELRIRDVCPWIREPDPFVQSMLRIDALPYDLPGGVWDTVEFDGQASFIEPLTLMAGMVGEPADIGVAPPLVWENETAGAGRRIVWTPVSGDEILPASSAVENGYVWWRYTPTDQSESRGSYYLSWMPTESDATFADTTWSSPSGTMQWNGMPVVGDDPAHTRFTMWYAPRTDPTDHVMASAQTARNWYLLTEEPLPRLDADIRFEFHSVYAK